MLETRNSGRRWEVTASLRQSEIQSQGTHTILEQSTRRNKQIEHKSIITRIHILPRTYYGVFRLLSTCPYIMPVISSVIMTSKRPDSPGSRRMVATYALGLLRYWPARRLRLSAIDTSGGWAQGNTMLGGPALSCVGAKPKLSWVLYVKTSAKCM